MDSDLISKLSTYRGLKANCNLTTTHSHKRTQALLHSSTSVGHIPMRRGSTWHNEPSGSWLWMLMCAITYNLYRHQNRAGITQKPPKVYRPNYLYVSFTIDKFFIAVFVCSQFELSVYYWSDLCEMFNDLRDYNILATASYFWNIATLK